MNKYEITVTATSETDSEVLVSGYGALRVLSYLATVAQDELKGRAESEDIAVKINEVNGAESSKVLAFSGDPETAADLIKSRIARLRRSLGGNEEPATA